jgi:hypothetical protein
MPSSALGQMISFAVERDDDQKFGPWIWVNVHKGDTVQKVASGRGHPELARTIAKANGIRSVRAKFSGRGKTRIKVPGRLRDALSFDALAGDEPPRIIAGYAKFDTVDRPQREGLTVFTGYDPIQMEVPLRFENIRGGGGGLDIERDCALLERMTGRGNFEGAGIGSPPVVRVSTTNARGEIVPLIPRGYQWSLQNPSAPLWRITNLDWDQSVPDGVLRNSAGNRIRQKVTVTLQKRSTISLATRA